MPAKNKRQFNTRLSDEARTILKHLAARFSISESAVLEFIIREKALSTDEERHTQSEKRLKERLAYLKTHPDSDPSQIWEAGYSAGWIQFQTRHKKENKQ